MDNRFKLEVKEYIDTMISSIIAAWHKEKEGDDSDRCNLIRAEIALFLMHMASSDGTIEQINADLISYYSGLNYTPQMIKKTIDLNNICSCEFENRIPISIKLLLNDENNLYEHGFEPNPYVCEMMLDLYKYIAAQLTNPDDVISKNKKTTDNYIRNIEKYINDGLVSHERR